MEFNEIAYSVAGLKAKKIYNVFSSLDKTLLTKKEVVLLDAMVHSFDEGGIFPSFKYLCENYGEFERKCRNPADVNIAVRELLKSRDLEKLKVDIVKDLESSTDPMLVRSNVSNTLLGRSNVGGRRLIKPGPSGEKYKRDKKMTKGYLSGVKEVDELTSGFRSGLVVSVAAWTSHGKSMFLYNSAYLNGKNGDSIAIIALEIPKDMVWLILLCRHSYEYGNKAIPYERALKNQLSDSDSDHLFNKVEVDFLKNFRIIVLGPEELPKPFTKESVTSLYREVEELMGGLTGVIWDHVNLFKYLDPTGKLTGDHAIKLLTEVGVVYRTSEDTKIGTNFAVQVNRQGWRSAQRNEGRYTMLALSDFNEIERSSTYVLFLYSDSYMMQVNEMKVQLQKHRIGAVMQDPVITYVYPECSVVGESYNTAPTDEGTLDGMLDSFLDGDGGLGDFGL